MYSDAFAPSTLLERISSLMSQDSDYYSLVKSLVKRENELRRSEKHLQAMSERERKADDEWMEEAELIQRAVVREAPDFIKYFNGDEQAAVVALQNAQWDFPEFSIPGKYNRCAMGLLIEGDAVPNDIMLADFDPTVAPAQALRVSSCGSAARSGASPGDSVSKLKAHAIDPKGEAKSWPLRSLRDRCRDLYRSHGKRWALLMAGSTS